MTAENPERGDFIRADGSGKKFAFIRDEGPRQWNVAIVEVVDEDKGVGELIDFNSLPSEEEAYAWASSVMGGISKTVYRRPDA